jgi:hypothetical protein
VTNLAKFTIEGTASSPGGYDATTGQTVHFALELVAALVNRWELQVYDPADPTAPLASYGAPLLSLVGTTTGQRVQAATPGAQITVVAPSGMNSWIVRSIVNGGVGANGKANPDYVWERMLVVRDGSGRRKTMATEATQYGPEGWARAVNDHLAAVPSSVAGGTELGQKLQWDGAVYTPRRNWITPGIDLTGAVDAAAAINSALSSRTGCCVELPDGIIKLNAPVNIPQGCTLTGAPRGGSIGHRVFAGVSNVGTRIDVVHTGKAFVPAQQSTLTNVTIYYPNQQTNATPDAYDWTVYLDANAHQVTIENISAINPYNFIRQGGNSASARIDNVFGFPLRRGIVLNRVPGTTRITNVEFNPAADYASGATLKAWTAANGAAYVIDGAEEFFFSGCFAYGYSIGIWAVDDDGDAFRGAYGSWTGGGLDFCHRGVIVDANNMLTARGFRMSNCGIIGDGSGSIALLFNDSHVPTGVDQRPAIFMTNVATWNSDFSVEMAAGSYGILSWLGGSAQVLAGPCFVRDGSNSKFALNTIVTSSGATRLGGAGSGGITDVNAISL